MGGQEQQKAVIIADCAGFSSVAKAYRPIRVHGDRIRGSFRDQTPASPTS